MLTFLMPAHGIRIHQFCNSHQLCNVSKVNHSFKKKHYQNYQYFPSGATAVGLERFQNEEGHTTEFTV